MKALILAAGYGRRLQPLTNQMPKSMVEVNGTPLLVNALNHLTALGITEIGIVVGHMADYIREHIGTEWNGSTITYFENKDYLTTNNVYSVYLASSFCDCDMLMLECDLFYPQTMLESLINGEGDCSILVSPFHAEWMDGSVVHAKNGKVDSLILGAWQGPSFDYTDMKKTVNMYRFSQHFIRDQYMPLIRWYVENMGTNCYYEKILGSLIYYRECDIRTVEVPAEMWCEIDDLQDLERARRKFATEN